MHVLFAVGSEAVFAWFDHADGGWSVRRGDNEALDFSIKIRIMFHAF